ncbi:unnamed protein product [Allacma fusca]|uniref:SAP domain-containing protein n=1 Tax=Allacma fusca TaxID=39272 RepID=A0A8J2L5L9_9HEXA|nr:unnamed protein product [Allacma fusca]
MEDISALKVADLKRELKERGLSCSGAKNELILRLQEAMTAEKPTSDDSAMDDVLLDEDSMLAGEDDDSSGAEVETSDNETSLNQGVDSTTSLGQSSPQKTGLVPSTIPASTIAGVPALSPDKKRNGTTEETEGESTAKKLKINREPVQPLPLKKVAPPSPTKAPVVASGDESSSSAAPPGKVNLKTLGSLGDRSKLRQQKFAGQTSEATNAVTATVGTDKLQQRAARFGISSTKPVGAVGGGAAKAAAVLSPEEEAALAKRRERFGKELTETKETADAAKQKRAQRFGGALTGNANDVDDKKKTRAARFAS